MLISFKKVSGDSMLPHYRDGDYVLALSAKLCRLREGDVWLVNHPSYGAIIKRILKIDGQRFWLVSDNTHEGTSTEKLGLLEQHNLIGKVIWHIKQ